MEDLVSFKLMMSFEVSDGRSRLVVYAVTVRDGEKIWEGGDECRILDWECKFF